MLVPPLTMNFISSVRSSPTPVGLENRRRVEREQQCSRDLERLRTIGFNYLKPPGIKKTMAMMLEEGQDGHSTNVTQQSIEASNGEYDQAFVIEDIPLPDASFLPPRDASVASWQTYEDSYNDTYNDELYQQQGFMPRSDPPMIPPSPVLDFAARRQSGFDL